MLDMVYMRDPTVQVNKRPILKKEVEDAGVFNLRDLDLHIGFAIKRDEYNDVTGGYELKGIESLPEGLLEFNTGMDGVTFEKFSLKELVVDAFTVHLLQRCEIIAVPENYWKTKILKFENCFEEILKHKSNLFSFQ